MNSNWSYSPETPNLGQIRRFLKPCDLEIWRMTLKNNRAPLLSIIKLYASFHHHMWIQTGVTVRNASVTLTFDLWHWPFARTSLLSMLITSENFMMIWWQEHSEKGVTDRQTDGRTDWTIHRAAWSQLKRHSDHKVYKRQSCLGHKYFLSEINQSYMYCQITQHINSHFMRCSLKIKLEDFLL